MQNWEDDDNDEYCSIKEDSFDAIAVADIVGIDIDIVNFAAQYKDKVFAYFLQEYRAGHTESGMCCAMQKSNSKVFSITRSQKARM